jgi:membrane protein YdbS with pleckstrin-like domain
VSTGPGDGGWPPDEPDHPRGEYDTEPLPVLSRRLSPPLGPGPGARRRYRQQHGGGPPLTEAGDALDDSVLTTEYGDPMPSPMVARYLFTTERFCGEWRRHWSILWREMVAVVAGTFLLGYLAGVTTMSSQLVVGAATVGWGLLLLWVAIRVGDWWFDRFVLTSRRVMVISGIVTRKVAMMPLARVTDMAYNQGPIGRVLNFGSFILESAGQDQALREVHHLPHPRQLYLLMLDEMYGPDPNPAPRRTRRRGDSTSGGD